MASLSNRLKALASTPQGQKAIARAKRELAKPENQTRLRKLAIRLRGRR